ncbi:hypothetical protein DFH09DRAFT_1364570 [Mycena vulgaris]|nr:hypothetical protein DFH09DRAFT_1364570 [Mycena vulgaris]
MEDPVLQELLEFLSTTVKPLICGTSHVGYTDTREPIGYDYHLPPLLRLVNIEHDPGLSSMIKDHWVETIKQRTYKSGDVLAIKASFRRGVRDLVPAEAVGELCVKEVQGNIHRISCPLATLSCFDIAPGEIDVFPTVFRGSESAESNTKADLLIGCQPRIGDKPEDWLSLWSSITQPKDLRDPFFQYIYTEEYKNIRTGNPRAILGIYLILWCLNKGYLETFWPQNDCTGCPKFRKSHTAADDSDGPNQTDIPLDAPDIVTINTNVENLLVEMRRLVVLAGEYDEKYNIPVNEQGTARNRPLQREVDSDDDDDPEESFSDFKSYKELLEDAIDKASDELDFPETIKDGLLRCVLNAAYMLIQVWAQMARHNGTVARLTCHNIGVIMTRHREDQTMTVSNFFEHTDTPILQATALTVYAYHDAVERHDEHLANDVPLWVADPYRGETSAARKLADQEEQEDEDTEGDGDGGDGGGDGGDGEGGAGGRGGGSDSSEDGSDGGSEGGPSGGGRGTAPNQEQNQARQARYQRRNEGYQYNINLDALHLAFRAPRNHLWSNGFSHFKRVGHKTIPAPGPVDDLTPRGQNHPSAYFPGNVGLELLAHGTPDQQRRASAGSTQSSRSSNSTQNSVASIFSEQTSSVPTSPSTTGSFTGASSRNSSPFPEKLAGPETGPGGPTSVTVCNAGILIDRLLGESAVGIVWAGKMILEDGTEEDDFIPIAVKMAVPREDTDGEAGEDPRDSVRREASVYESLAKSGKPDISPRYYGVFEDKIGTVALILENGGTALKSFGNLTGDEAQTLFGKVEEMHSVGIFHHDLVPRNIVRSPEGELRIIDFHLSVRHRCSGKDKCKELLEFSQKLGL